MGAQLFGRYLDLTIAPTGGGAGVQVRDLRVTFKIKKTATSQANEAEIEIYNLSRQSMTAIDRRNQGIVLKAGYQDLSGTLFIGNLRRVEHSRDGTDQVSKIEALDGGKALYESKFHRSYTSGTPRLAVIRELVGSLTGVDLGLTSATGLRGNTQQRIVLSGLSRVCLDKVCRAWGVEFSVQDGAAQFLDPTGTRGGWTLAIKLSPASGLIGQPAKTQRGCKFTSLLRADMLPGSYVIVAESAMADGNYRVQSLEHAGDTHSSGNWLTTGEGVRL